MLESATRTLVGSHDVPVVGKGVYVRRYLDVERPVLLRGQFLWDRHTSPYAADEPLRRGS